jgi:beta-1,4-mannosyltransferase
MLERMTGSEARPPRIARVGVVVLGELGRSPRMVYHALALASAGAEVHLLGEAGSGLPAAVARSRSIAVHPLRPPRSIPGLRRGTVSGAVRAAQRAAYLGAALGCLPRLDTLLVQVPPAFPTLVVARRACRRTPARLVVDWHNLAAPLAALRLGAGHPAVRWLGAHELGQGARADAHLCVSDALAAALAGHGITATVFPDRPAARFCPTPPEEARGLGQRLGAVVPELSLPAPERPVLVVCPSGYTDDDDFDLLLAAVPELDRRVSAAPGSLPRVVVLLTGDGPRRREVESRIAALTPGHVEVRTVWLEADDYPLLLGAANVGLCLHRSASGLDLPMKVADLLGAGLPVCALAYPCLGEQLANGVDSVLVDGPGSLAGALGALLDGFPSALRLAELRAGVMRSRVQTWERTWEERCQSVLLPGRGALPGEVGAGAASPVVSRRVPR